MDDDDEVVTLARRAVVSRRLFFSHRIARPMFFMGLADVFVAFIFAAVPDDRTSENDQMQGIFIAQARARARAAETANGASAHSSSPSLGGTSKDKAWSRPHARARPPLTPIDPRAAPQAILSWLNMVISAALVALIWTTYSVTQRELTFERQSRVGYLIVIKVGQIIVCIALTAYPTFIRNLVGISLALLDIVQVRGEPIDHGALCLARRGVGRAARSWRVVSERD